MLAPCKKCGLRHSSYCVGCANEMIGMGYTLQMDYLADKKACEEDTNDNTTD